VGCGGGFIRIFSWNVRGVGGFEKRKEVWKLVLEKKSFYLVVTKTKLYVADDYLCFSIWGSTSIGFSFWSLVCASGGLLTF